MAVVLAALSVVSAPTPASAATCYAGSCTGKDPRATGCDRDATNLGARNLYSSTGSQVGKVELRYSQACRAAWARATSTSGSRYMLIELAACNVFAVVAPSKRGTGTVIWTVMYNGPDLVKARGRIYHNDLKGAWSGETNCGATPVG